VIGNPFTGDGIGANGVRDKIPGAVSDQGSKLFFYDMTLVRIDEGGVDGGGHC
jgi:hypothetical protein